MSIRKTIFDIETGSLPLDQIQHLKPEFKAPANYKDPLKIEENVKEQEARWLADGALSALTGRVLCIGTLEGPDFQLWADSEDSEMVLLQHWWNWTREYIQGGHLLIGFCSNSFDLPFLIRRSWALQIDVPSCLWDGRYWSRQLIDVAERWACGGREPRDRVSLDNLSKFLGTGQKNGEGKDFAALWATDKAKATEYVKTDCLLTQNAYLRLFPQ